MAKRTDRLYIMVTPQEKQKICAIAGTCGLTPSEYVRQRCLGYAPREIPPDVFYSLCEKLDAAIQLGSGDAVLDVLDELRRSVIEPGRDI